MPQATYRRQSCADKIAHRFMRTVGQPSYRIDTRIGNPLANLPEFEGVAHRIEANLAY